MAVTNYVPVSFGAGPLDVNDLNQITSNQQYLFEHLPTTFYQFNQNGGNGATTGPMRNTGLRFFGGWVRLPPTNAQFTNFVLYFGNTFTPGTYPTVVTGLHAFPQTGGSDIKLYQRSIQGGATYIDDKGVVLSAYAAAGGKITAPVLAHFLAYGV